MKNNENHVMLKNLDSYMLVLTNVPKWEHAIKLSVKYRFIKRLKNLKNKKRFPKLKIILTIK